MRSSTDIIPRREWILALSERRKDTVGSIVIASETGIEKVRELAASILKFGPGIKAGKLGLEVGTRFIFRGFLKYANPIEHDEKWEDGSAKEYFLMAIDDILAVVPAELSVGPFSGVGSARSA